MNKNLLLTRPNHDVTTNYLYFWCNPILEFARSRTFSIHDLADKKANKKELNSHLQARNIGFFFLNGHGNEDTVYGQNDEPLLQTGDDLSSLNGVIIYIRSCKTMKNLGVQLIQQGVKACIGYTKNFSFYH